jgi:predicted Fe-Mo cluster-binding NifX family protein
MRIAIPLADGKLAQHFGHCRQFALLDADVEGRQITGKQIVDAPEHAPGLLPSWLKERKATVVIAGGMGRRAQAFFKEGGIHVITGAPPGDPEEVAHAYLQNALVTGANACDH